MLNYPGELVLTSPQKQWDVSCLASASRNVNTSQHIQAKGNSRPWLIAAKGRHLK